MSESESESEGEEEGRLVDTFGCSENIKSPSSVH